MIFRRWNSLTDIIAKLKKKMTKENMFVIMLLGVLFLVIAIPVKEETAAEEVQTETVETEEDQEEDHDMKKMEERLKDLLQSMDGVGEVTVMITWKSSEEVVVEKDMVSECQENTVYRTESDGTRTPYVIMSRSPEVEGVTVVAEGGGNGYVQKNITEVIEALFGIDAHKIKVVKMK